LNGFLLCSSSYGGQDDGDVVEGNIEHLRLNCLVGGGWVMFKKFDHIALLVRDTEEAQTFYRDTLKLEVLVSEELSEVG
jgi:hypothetical protein